MSQFHGNRGSMVRQRSGKGNDFSNLPPQQNIAVMIDQLVVATRGKSDPENDYAEVFLLHDIPDMGLTAEFSPEGAPMTKMKVKMPLPKAGGDGRRDIQGLTMKKAGGSPMGQGSIVVFEKAWFDKKEGIIKAHFSRGGPSDEDQQNGLKSLYPGIMVCVLPEKQYKQADGSYAPAGRQEAMVADEQSAVLVNSEDELRTQVEAIVANNNIGTPGFQLHCRQLADENLSDAEKLAFASNPETRMSGFVVAKPKLVGEGEQRQWVDLSVDEIIEKLWKNFPQLKDKLGQPGYQIELVPMMVVAQAKTLTPSHKQNDKARDNSTIYALYDVIDEQGTIGVFDYGWAASHIIVERMATDSKVWYATYQAPTSVRAPMYALPDMPTPNMPDYHRAAVTAEAARLGENKAAFYRARRAEKEAPAAGGPAPR